MAEPAVAEQLKRPLLYALLAAALFALPLLFGHRALLRGTLRLERLDREAKLAEIRRRTAVDPHRHLLKLLRNNLTATAILLVAGAGSAGLFSVFYLGWFGLNMGLLIAQLSRAGIDGALICALLVPHGLIEVPALCLAGGVGLRCGWAFARYLRSGALPEAGERRQLLWTAGISLGMIVLAALVEAYLTPWVARGYL